MPSVNEIEGGSPVPKAEPTLTRRQLFKGLGALGLTAVLSPVLEACAGRGGGKNEQTSTTSENAGSGTVFKRKGYEITQPDNSNILEVNYDGSSASKVDKQFEDSRADIESTPGVDSGESVRIIGIGETPGSGEQILITNERADLK